MRDGAGDWAARGGWGVVNRLIKKQKRSGVGGRGEAERGHCTSAGTVVIHVDTCVSTETGSGENITREALRVHCGAP